MTTLDVGTAAECSREAAEWSSYDDDLNRKAAVRRSEEVIEWAYQLAANGSTFMDVV